MPSNKHLNAADSIPNRKRAEEEHRQQEQQVEVIIIGGFEDRFGRDVGGDDGPRTHVQHDHELEGVESRQPGREEHTHPGKSVMLYRYYLRHRHYSHHHRPQHHHHHH